jgi:hypothetical protein
MELIANVDGTLEEREPRSTGSGIVTAQPDGSLGDDSAVELSAEIKQAYRAAKAEYAGHVERAVAVVNGKNAMAVLREGGASPAALHEIAGRREAALAEVTQDRDLSEEGRLAGYAKVHEKFDAEVGEVFQEFDKVREIMDGIEVPWPGGPE